MTKSKKLSKEITIKVKVKVKRKVYDKIKKWGDANEMSDTIESNLEALVSGWFEHWDKLVDEMEGKSKTVAVPKSPLLGMNGKPMGRA